MEHTKGPWKYDDVWAMVLGPSDEEICAIHSGVRNGKLSRNTALDNAQLITAAPEMLEALKLFADTDLTPIVKFFNSRGEAAPSGVFFAQERARAAIAKAEGK